MDARYTIVVGTKNWSSWSLRPYVALRATGVPFEEIVIGLRRPDTAEQIAKFSPSGRVPVLKVEEGGATYQVWDSLAICEFLAERHPEAALWPDAAADRAEARSLTAEMHAGFGELREKLPMDIARVRATPELGNTVRGQVKHILAMWDGLLARNEDRGGFLFGRFSIADCFYAPVVTRFRTYAITQPQRVANYAQRIFALPAMRDWESAAREEVARGEA